MSAHEAVTALRQAVDELPNGDEADGAVAKLHDDLEAISERARVVAFVEDLQSHPAVEDVQLNEFRDAADAVNINVELAHDVELSGPEDLLATTVDSDVQTQTSDAPEAEDDGSDDGADESAEADVDEESGKKWCGRCGADFDTERGAKVHNGRSHEADEAIVLDEEPTEEDLVGDVQEDSEPEEDSDVDGDSNVDSDADEGENPEEADEESVEWSEGDDEASEEEDVVDDDDSDESPLADDEDEHKYETGDKLSEDVTEEPEADGGSTVVDYDEDALDDLDDDLPDPGVVVESAGQHDIETIRGLADEIGVGDTAIVRIIAHRLDLYDTVLPRPEGQPNAGVSS